MCSEVYVELCQTSKMKLLVKIVNGIYPLSILIENSVLDVWKDTLPFHHGGRYYIETSPLICGANQWTGFYMVTASVMKGLKQMTCNLFST